MPLLLPVVPAGFTGILRIGLTLPLDAQDTLILAVIGDPLVAPGLDPQFVMDTVAGATAHVQQNFGVAIPPALVPALEQYLTAQLEISWPAVGRPSPVAWAPRSQLYSLAHLSLDPPLFAVVQAASALDARHGQPIPGTPEHTAGCCVRAPGDGDPPGLARADQGLAQGGAARGQNCGILGEGQSEQPGCGGKQDALPRHSSSRDSNADGLDPTKPRVRAKQVPAQQRPL